MPYVRKLRSFLACQTNICYLFVSNFRKKYKLILKKKKVVVHTDK
jgi:hypothetical protein